MRHDVDGFTATVGFPLLLAGTLLAGIAASGCGEGPAPLPEGNTCVKTVTADVDVPTQRAADILIVVDNSGSMLEEQQNLADNFLNTDPAACPLTDLKNIPEAFKNPSAALYEAGGPLAQCGFIQLVAAFENDFRVGVVTTDVGVCDNRIPEVQGGDAWGFRPQRGCLQPDSAPVAAPAVLRKIIARADLDDEDTTNDDLATRFKGTLDNIRTFGSPFERGLDAMADFLDPAANRAPGCENDFEDFRRDNADLVVIFLTDEEDCSHGRGDSTFPDELEGEVCGRFDGLIINHSPADCYARKDELSPIELYRDALIAAEPRAKVAVIAGGIASNGVMEPAGCRVGADGAPEGGCFASGGLSNFTGPGLNQPCGPDTADARGGLPCCVADAGSRYYAFAGLVAQRATDSICNSSFRGSMISLAAFIAASDVVVLAEPPDSPDAILVQITRVGADSAEVLPRLDDPASCTSTSGYFLEGADRIVLCGDARPGPGDRISVLARADANTATGSGTCRPTNLQATGGGYSCGATATAEPLAVLAMLLALPRLRRRAGVAR